MFQSLASYFLGNSTNYDTGSVEQQQTILAQHLDDPTVDVLPKPHKNIIAKPLHGDEDESDWLIVDKDDSPPQTDSEEEIPFVEIKNAPVVHKRGRHSRNNSAGAGTRDGLLSLSPTSILPSSMEESWFVTPPPCFTSSGPIVMEMSPFENLLIEHPSMSVYHSMRKSSADDADDEDIIVVNMGRDLVHPAADRNQVATVRVRGEHARPAGLYRSMKQFVAANNSQKGNGAKLTQSLCRNALERSNKVREVNSKGGRQKRCDMNHSKVISRANNNRKC